jgi:CheY-like chemotaxis protein
MPYQKTLHQQTNKTTADKNIDLRQLVATIKAFNSSVADQKGNIIKLVIDEKLPNYIFGNEVQLYQVLNKLLSKAIQTVTNGWITIGVTLSGIEGDDVSILFSFSYTDGEPGKDATLHFRVGFKKGVDPFYKEWTSMQQEKDLGGIRILLVEDVEYNVMIAQKMLTSWNARVDVAENGVEAITLARQTHYDIILMDLQMPVMDGYSATRHIRFFDQQTPIIALTASAFPDIMKINDGLTDFMSKPFKPANLYDTVYKYTHKNKMAS